MIPVPIALLKTQVIEFRNYPYSTSFRPHNEQHHKPLKQWFKHWNVSPWQRSQTPQLWVAGQLVGVLGRGAAYAWLEQQTDQQCRYFHLVPRIP